MRVDSGSAEEFSHGRACPVTGADSFFAAIETCWNKAWQSEVGVSKSLLSPVLTYGCNAGIRVHASLVEERHPAGDSDARRVRTACVIRIEGSRSLQGSATEEHGGDGVESKMVENHSKAFGFEGLDSIAQRNYYD